MKRSGTLKGPQVIKEALLCILCRYLFVGSYPGAHHSELPSIGDWHCYTYDATVTTKSAYRGLIIMSFAAAEVQPEDGSFSFTATGSVYTGEGWSLTGTCKQAEDDTNLMTINWFLKYTDS